MIKVIFFGNGPLADHTLSVLEKHFDIIFHARTSEDLTRVVELKKQYPEAYGILASFGVIIKKDLLEMFEPTGILNIHPSLLPLYRGASPIESAILDGDNTYGVSIMKLAEKMDAGPVYYQTTVTPDNPLRSDLKSHLYKVLAASGAEWLAQNITNLPTPVVQDDKKATFTTKLDKSMSLLQPEKHPAEVILRQILAFQGYPKPKYTFFGHECIILEAHLLNQDESAPLMIPCQNGQNIAVDYLQPADKKPMDVRSFLNGYNK